MVDSAIADIVRRYISALSEIGIQAKRAVVYGSFARGESNRYSDIDLIVIAPEFDRPFSRDLVEELWKARLKADIRIEPIPCGEREWETEGGRPILDIARREGFIIGIMPPE